MTNMLVRKSDLVQVGGNEKQWRKTKNNVSRGCKKGHAN